MTPQLALFSLAHPTRPPGQPTEQPCRIRPDAKPKKDQQDIRQKWTRAEREQEDQAFLTGLACRIPPRGVPQLWTCFGTKGERLMCSWCGWSFDRRTNELKWAKDGRIIRACPRCPAEHPENRPARLPADEDQGELFD